MGQSHEFPRRQAFGQSEAQGHHAARIGHQTGIEKGCFIQILTDGHARSLIHFRLCGTFHQSLLLLRGGFQSHVFRRTGRRRGFLLPHRHLHPGNPTVARCRAHYQAIVRNHEHLFHGAQAAPRHHHRIEIVEPQGLDGFTPHRSMVGHIVSAIQPKLVYIHTRQRERDIMGKIPRMRLYAVQRGIVKRSHQLCRGGQAVGPGYAEVPCLFASRQQAVAERSPREA